MTHVPINDVAKLGNLTLTSQELDEMSKKLDDTVTYIENLSELDTGVVAVTASPTGTKNVYFEDGLQNERGLKPGIYKVNRII